MTSGKYVVTSILVKDVNYNSYKLYELKRYKVTMDIISIMFIIFELFKGGTLQCVLRLEGYNAVTTEFLRKRCSK